ncbi:hypothetical protein AC1031_019522 [Aphanomyces cochlioides]|nr:hypothetical protein AC1031_019522 [Aphanomyces cochlioides]
MSAQGKNNSPCVLSRDEDTQGTTKRRPNLRDSERQAFFERLLELSTNGMLPLGSIAALAAQYQRDCDTIVRIWQRGMQTRQQGDGAADVSARIKVSHMKSAKQCAHLQENRHPNDNFTAIQTRRKELKLEVKLA